MSDMVYVLTVEAVYDHGCAGVFLDRDAAEAAAAELYAESDGYHEIRVNEVPVNTPIPVRSLMVGDRHLSRYLEPVTYRAWTGPEDR